MRLTILYRAMCPTCDNERSTRDFLVICDRLSHDYSIHINSLVDNAKNMLISNLPRIIFQYTLNRL